MIGLCGVHRGVLPICNKQKRQDPQMFRQICIRTPAQYGVDTETKDLRCQSIQNGCRQRRRNRDHKIFLRTVKKLTDQLPFSISDLNPFFLNLYSPNRPIYGSSYSPDRMIFNKSSMCSAIFSSSSLPTLSLACSNPASFSISTNLA